MKSIDHIGQEFFRFEMATAVAGAILGISPFNQPDVSTENPACVPEVAVLLLTVSFDSACAIVAARLSI